MRLRRLLFSSALVGLAMTLGPTSFAQPEGGKPRPHMGPQAPGAKSGDKRDKGPMGAPGHGPLGKPGGPMGKPGEGRGMPGHGPMGMPGRDPMGHAKRFAELEAKEKAGTLTDEEKAELEKIRSFHAKHQARREARRARFAELQEKEKAGTLTDEEKAELEKITQIRERFTALQKKHIQRMRDRKERRRENRRKLLKAFPSLVHNPEAHEEFVKHARRVAKLERAREVAEAGGRDELLTRIDKLLEKENARHDDWLAKRKGDVDKGAKPAEGGTP